MSDEEIDRKIAVIFATDVVGYSKHMETDESETVKALRACEKVLSGLFDKHKARLFNTGGDSFLAEFPSAVSAIECGVEFQNAIKDRNASDKATVKLEFRIGINSGDVIKEKDNLLGDGVNIAARLEALAQTGGITISKGVYDFVKGKTNFEFNDLGIQKVKQNEFHAFDLLLDENKKRKLKKSINLNPAKAIMITVVLALLVTVSIIVVQRNNFFDEQLVRKEKKVASTQIDKPSVLILPFENLSGKEDKDYLSLGMTSNLHSTLSGIETILLLPSSTGKFVYKNQYSDQEILAQYGVQFIVRGSLQSYDKSNRLAVEMLDLANAKSVWSEVYDFKEDQNIFTVQDNISISILERMRIEFDRGGMEFGAERASKDAENYKRIIKARSLFSKNNASSNLQAEKLFKEALLLEPNNNHVKVNLGWVYWQRIIIGASRDVPNDIQRAYSIASEVLLDAPEKIGAISLVTVMELMSKDYDQGCKRLSDMEKLSAAPIDFALTASAQQSCGELSSAIQNYEYVMTTAPHFSSWVKNRYSFALVANNEFDKAIKFFKEQIGIDHMWAGAKRDFYLLSAYIFLKRSESSKAAENFSLHKTPGKKPVTQQMIRRQLSMDKDQRFVEDYIDTLIALGLE